jgi:DNA-binding transcriptional ArsR family regulator
MKQALEHETDKQAAVFSALADPTRLKLVKLLCRQRSHEALCVNALAARLGVTQPAVSQHLRVLKGIGLVNGERRGYHIHYFINRERLESCRELVSATLNMGESGEAQRCQDDCPDRRNQDV